MQTVPAVLVASRGQRPTAPSLWALPALLIMFSATPATAAPRNGHAVPQHAVQRAELHSGATGRGARFVPQSFATACEAHQHGRKGRPAEVLVQLDSPKRIWLVLLTRFLLHLLLPSVTGMSRMTYSHHSHSMCR